MTDESYITFPIFDQFIELTCAFSTRCGGYSEGPFTSLNMGNIKFDDPILVGKNRSLFFEKVGITKEIVALPDQVHSATIRNISSAGIIPTTDALITTKKGLYIGVQTADCFPVFIYAPKIRSIAVIHAGWRGAVQNIVFKTLDLLIGQLGTNSTDLYVAIGPGLQSECFEVRSDVYQQFPANHLITHQDTTKRYLNLSGYLIQQIRSRNIPKNQIYADRNCTKCNQEQFFSFRRDGEKSGRMMGIIGMRF
jgi:YfiH family protein